MLGDGFQLLARGEASALLTVRVDDLQAPVVEINTVFLIHQAHVVRAVGIGFGGDWIHVFLVLQENLFKGSRVNPVTIQWYNPTLPISIGEILD
jgi:hypothetical protein